MKPSLKQVGYVLAVGAFIALLFFSIKSEAADFSPYVELNRTAVNSELTVGGVGVRYINRWELGVQYLGEGETKKGYQEAKPMVHFSRVVNPSWVVLGGGFFTGIGIAHTPNQRLIGDTNFRLTMGLRWDNFEVSWQHYSSADMWEMNRGLDMIGLRILL